MGYHTDAIDLSYEMRERKRRALKGCPDCDGEGTVTYTASVTGDVEAPCPCLMRAGSFEDAPNPLADEGQSDARELARER